MNAVVAEKSRMVEVDRIARIESDVTELKGDVKSLSASFSEFKTDVAKAFAAVREEMAKGFGTIREEVAHEFGAVRKEMANESGSVRVEIESLRTSIERLKVWMLGTGISTVLGIAILVGLKLH